MCKIAFPSKISFCLSILFLKIIFSGNVLSQIVKDLSYSYSPVNNYASMGNSIVCLPSGVTFTGGIYDDVAGSYNKNVMVMLDNSGILVSEDTSTIGFGFSKILYDGFSSVYALATSQDDSMPFTKVLIAKYDTSLSQVDYFYPDSNSTPYYQALDFSLLSTGNLIVASNWESFPLRCLSLICINSTGNILWMRVDSTFEFSYDVKILPDLSGGLFVAGSGRDTSTSYDFIFVSHFDSSGMRDWTFQYPSPANFFADMNDIIRDVNGNVLVSGVVMDTSGQVGFLIKVDSVGNTIWNKPISPLSYLKIVQDHSGNIYGAKVPLNGVDVFTLDKLDTSGTIINSSAFQLTGYFASELGDIILTDSGTILATGALFVSSFPKSDLFVSAFDTSLNLIDYNIFDSTNLLGESGKRIALGPNGSFYSCGRINYENQFETANLGVLKYDITLINRLNVINDELMFEVFPSPSSGHITLRFGFSGNENVNLQIFNIYGVSVFTDVIRNNVSEKSYSLKLRSGIYNVVVESGSRRVSRKLCVFN